MIGVDLLRCILQTITHPKAKGIVRDGKTTLSHLNSHYFEAKLLPRSFYPTSLCPSTLVKQAEVFSS